MWYVDCYSWGQASGMGRTFPVNTYYSESLLAVIMEAGRLLGTKRNGIDEVRISRETKGQSPAPVTTIVGE